MAHFLFYFGDKPAIKDKARAQTEKALKAPCEFSSNGFLLFHEQKCSQAVVRTGAGIIGILRGYFRLLNSGSREGGSELEIFFQELVHDQCWPLRSNTTGSFAAVGYSAKTGELTICNDLIGYQPIYFSRVGAGVIGGSRLVDVGHILGTTPDAIGVLERLTSPGVNYGARTILDRVQRLLPGQCLRFSDHGLKESSYFDNTLCSDVLTGSLGTVAEQVWESLRRETVAACGTMENLNVALSGGWDSRHMLGAVAHSTNLHCWAYGSEQDYEVRVARKCAEAVDSRFASCSVRDKLFPSRPVYKKYVCQTESVNHLQWLPLIESAVQAEKSGATFVLGDMCETIQGRNILGLSSREARIQNFIGNLVGRKRPLVPCSPKLAFEWKKSKKDLLLAKICRQTHILSPSLRDGWTDRSIMEAVEGDLEQSFQRIEANLPPFAIMLDELFNWFHKARLFMATQCLLLDGVFRAVCPGMGTQFMRLISCVPPQMREQRRLLTAIARLPEFSALGRIPSAQIPWVGATAPLPLRLVIWGARSKCDQWLAKRAIRTDDPSARKRLLPSLDIVTEYRRASTLPHVAQWFSNHWVERAHYVEIARRRANLEAWPYSNDDIASAANLSITLDCFSGDE